MRVFARVGGPNAAGTSTNAAKTVNSSTLTASSRTPNGDTSRGPVIGVLAMPRMPSAANQQVSGAAPHSASSRHRAGAPVVLNATWTVARAMPVANQRA
jgi:hypothetical protein